MKRPELCGNVAEFKGQWWVLGWNTSLRLQELRSLPEGTRLDISSPFDLLSSPGSQRVESPEQSARGLKHFSLTAKAWEYVLDSIKKPGKLSVPPQAKAQKTAQLSLWPGLCLCVRLCTANQRDAGTPHWSAFKHKAGRSVGPECNMTQWPRALSLKPTCRHLIGNK